MATLDRLAPRPRSSRRTSLAPPAQEPGAPVRDDTRDVLEGIGGAARMVLALASPFRRVARSHWGLDAEMAARELPGDDIVLHPRWSWTHGVEIDAPADEVWPWIAQIGANRGGFYSYQWLENMAGCNLHNADTVHPEWELDLGDTVVLHPKMPPLTVVAAERGRWFVIEVAPNEVARMAGKPWVAATWLLFLEPIDALRCRLISRYRVECSHDLETRLQFGPTIFEPVSFAMDRRMLLGIKARAEAPARPRLIPVQ